MLFKSVFSICAAVLGSIVSLAYGQESAPVHVPDQTITVRPWEKPNLIGTIQDGAYAGVQFLAEPDDSMPLPAASAPKNLLAKLDPSLLVVGVGTRGDDRPMSGADIESALPRTMYRLKSLFAPDGQAAVMLGQPPVFVFISAYKTTPSRPPTKDEVMSLRFKEEKHVVISDFVVSFTDLPPCHAFSVRICSASE